MIHDYVKLPAGNQCSESLFKTYPHSFFKRKHSGTNQPTHQPTNQTQEPQHHKLLRFANNKFHGAAVRKPKSLGKYLDSLVQDRPMLMVINTA